MQTVYLHLQINNTKLKPFKGSSADPFPNTSGLTHKDAAINSGYKSKFLLLNADIDFSVAAIERTVETWS